MNYNQSKAKYDNYLRVNTGNVKNAKYLYGIYSISNGDGQ